MQFEVKAGNHNRIWSPVNAELPHVPDTPIAALVDRGTGVIVPAQQWQRTNGQPMLSWIVPHLRASGAVQYAPVHVPNQQSEGVRIVAEEHGKLDILVGADCFTTYHFGPSLTRPYFYPVHAATEIGITRNWPMVEGVSGETNDHPHHKGIYTAQGEVNGVDNWGEAQDGGKQIHRTFLKTFDGPVDGGFVEEIDWTDATGKPNLSETRFIKFFAATDGIRLVDYSVSLHASAGRVVLGDTKEAGLLSVRVASSMDALQPDGGRITNAYGGMQEAETWGKPSPWCDYSGPIGSSWYGICLMDHPDNPRHPTPWHVRDYGLMTANCFGYHDFTGNPDNRHDLVIESGDSRTWHYRILVHSGGADEADVSGHYLNFAFPPAVSVITK